MIVNKRSLTILFCLVFFSLTNCKKEQDCVRCETSCTSFNEFPTFYCLYDFNDSLEYVNFVDSMLQIYTLEDTFIRRKASCENITTYKNEMEAENWRCKITKEKK